LAGKSCGTGPFTFRSSVNGTQLLTKSLCILESGFKTPRNRQNSIVTDDPELEEFWNVEQEYIWSRAYSSYKDALKNGVAKELARKLLPEGLTRTRMYMNGTIRDWLHYLSIRTGPETQYEHRLIAKEVESVFKLSCPVVYQAAQQAGLIGFVK
jgi:thymidylate synthase (FAD)